MFHNRFFSRWFGLAFSLLLVAVMGWPPVDTAGPGASARPAAVPPGLNATVSWPYKGLTYVSWTRGDYPWTASWRAETYPGSQAVSQVAITTTNPYEGQGALALAVNLIGGDPNHGSGETFVDLRYHPPRMESTCCLSSPLDLAGSEVSAQVYCPAGSRGDPSKPNGLQLFARSADADGNWWSFYGSWHDIREGAWNTVTMTPGPTAPPGGYKDPLFDPARLVALGLKIGAGDGSTAEFHGPCWLDNVRWSAGCAEAKYGFEDVENALDQLVRTHANYVALVVTWYMDDAASTVIAPDSQQTHTDAELIAAIQAIHERKMAVMLKPHVDTQDGTWRGELAPDDVGAWFASYQAFITQYAELAEANQVELFSVGTELASLSGSAYETRWDSVINAVKTHYTGPLTYSANWGAAPGAEYLNVSFWDRLNLAGVDAYFPLSDEADPTLEQLIAGWSSYHGNCWLCDLESWQATLGRPVIFTEIGYGSRNYAAREPWLADVETPNCALQARALQAAIAVFRDKPWFQGMFWWTWTPFSGAGGCCDRGFSPQHKPAAALLACTYGRCLHLPLVLKGD